MPDQPSKESLERAAKLVDWWLSYPDGGDDPESRTLRDRLALEFDAIAKERDAALIHAQNVALVSALRLAKGWILHGMPVSARYPRGHALPEIEKALTPYAPAEAEAKEKP